MVHVDIPPLDLSDDAELSKQLDRLKNTAGTMKYLFQVNLIGVILIIPFAGIAFYAMVDGCLIQRCGVLTASITGFAVLFSVLNLAVTLRSAHSHFVHYRIILDLHDRASELRDFMRSNELFKTADK